MKKLLFLALMCIISVAAHAQWKVTSVDNSEMIGNKFLQVIQTEESTLVFGTLTKNDGEVHGLSINPKTVAVVNGTSYKLRNSVNLPITDDGEHRTINLDNQINSVNYVMEFDKFNPEEGFNIVEHTDKHGDGYFNFKGIHVTKMEESEALDTKKFLDCPHVIRGYYYQDGNTYCYYIKDDLMVRQQTTKDGAIIFYTKVVNNSGHGVSFDLNKVTVIGEKKGMQTPVKLYTPDKYDNKMARERYYEAKAATGGYASDHLSFQLDRERYKTNNSWAKIGFLALEGLNEQAKQNRISQYLQDHPDDGPKALRSSSLKDGEEIYGYIAAKNKGFDDMVMTIPIDGYNFIFTWNLK